MQVNTGFGYFKDSSGTIVRKYVFPIGEHSDPIKKWTQVEVASQEELDKIIIVIEKSDKQKQREAKQQIVRTKLKNLNLTDEDIDTLLT